MSKLTDTIEIDGVKIHSYYNKYVVNSLREAVSAAEKMDYIGGVRKENEEYGQLFNSKEEFDVLIKDVEFPVAIVPML